MPPPGSPEAGKCPSPWWSRAWPGAKTLPPRTCFCWKATFARRSNRRLPPLCPKKHPGNKISKTGGNVSWPTCLVGWNASFSIGDGLLHWCGRSGLRPTVGTASDFGQRLAIAGRAEAGTNVPASFPPDRLETCLTGDSLPICRSGRKLPYANRRVRWISPPAF